MWVAGRPTSIPLNAEPFDNITSRAGRERQKGESGEAEGRRRPRGRKEEKRAEEDEEEEEEPQQQGGLRRLGLTAERSA